MGTASGLRERKKAATRTALSEAAMQLAVDSGPEHVTAEAIAAAAGVSTRTFHNYFSSKDDAILAAFREQFRDLVDQIRTRPADEPIWDVLEAVSLSSVSAARSVDDAIARMRAVDSPAIVANALGMFDEIERMAVEAIAERTGTDAETDMYPHLLSAAAAAAMRASITLWERGGRKSRLEDLVASAFAQLRAGLPPPQ